MLYGEIGFNTYGLPDHISHITPPPYVVVETRDHVGPALELPLPVTYGGERHADQEGAPDALCGEQVVQEGHHLSDSRSRLVQST
jgi:hypothetical protein